MQNIEHRVQDTTQEGGYSLVEALIAITVMLVAIVAPLYIAYQGVRLAAHARDQVAAVFLAQDGLEYMRSRMESNVFNGLDLVTGSELQNCLGTIDRCQYDTFSGALINDCNAASCTEPLYQETATGVYRQDPSGGGVSVTNLKREMYLNEIVTDEEYEIVVEVFYGQAPNRTSVVLKELFLEWRTEF